MEDDMMMEFDDDDFEMEEESTQTLTFSTESNSAPIEDGKF